jgi:hypothetical protein
MRNLSTRVVGKIKTSILYSVIPPPPGKSCCLCCLRDNVEKYGRARQATDDNIVWLLSFACWITKATDTHSEYVILIAFSQQKRLRERATILRYT